MPTAIRFAESALVDLEAIQTWNAQESVPEVGARLVSKIPAQIEHLADHDMSEMSFINSTPP